MADKSLALHIQNNLYSRGLMINYTQCELKRQNGDRTISWIPQSFAIEGKYLKLKDEGVWTNGWKVERVGCISLPENLVLQNRDDYRKTREASDI